MTLEEAVEKWRGINPEHRGLVSILAFQDDMRELTGAGLNQVVEASRIENWDFKFTYERLRGNRPPEWKLKYEELEQRIDWLERLLKE